MKLAWPVRRRAMAAVFMLVVYAASPARAQELPSGPVSLAGGAVVIGTDVSVSLTPHHYQETEHHKRIFSAHFVEKGREAARAALAIGKVRAKLAA